MVKEEEKHAFHVKKRPKIKSFAMNYRAFSCDVIAATLEGKNNTFSLLWEIRSIFMQNCFIVMAAVKILYTGKMTSVKVLTDTVTTKAT